MAERSTYPSGTRRRGRRAGHLGASALLALLGLLGSLLLPPGPAGAAVASAPGVPTAVQAVAKPLAAQVSWAAPTSTGSSAITSYLVTSAPDAVEIEVPAGVRTALVDGLRAGVGYTFMVRAVNASGPGAASAASASVVPTTPGARLVPLTVARVVDTRTGLGGQTGVLAAGAGFDATLAGRGGVPATGAAAVLVSLHTARSKAGGAVRVFPAGTAAPVPATLTSALGAASTLTLVRLSPTGAVRVTNDAGSAHVALDVLGWLPTARTTPGSQGTLVQVAPRPLLTEQRVTAGSSVPVPVAGQGGVPAAGAAAVLLRVRASAVAVAGTISVAPTSTAPGSGAGALSTSVGAPATALALVPVGGGSVHLRATTDSTAAIEVLGWVPAADVDAAGSWTTPLPAARVLDTRSGTGGISGALVAGRTYTTTVAGRGGVPPATSSVPPTAVLLSVTAVAPSTAGFLSATGTGTRDLELAAGKPRSTVVAAPLGPDGKVRLSLSSGSSHVTADVVGYLAGAQVAAARARVLAPAAVSTLASVTEGSVVFASTAPAQVTGLKVGDVLVAGQTAKTPRGLLRRVRTVGRDGSGRWVVSTEPAALTDAVKQADLSVRSTTGGGGTATGSASADSTAGDFVGGTDTIALGGGGSVSVSYSLDASLDLDLDVQLDPFHPVDARLELGYTESFSASLDARVAGQTQITHEFLRRPLAPITVFVGPVPVVLVPEITAETYISGSVSGTTTASMNRSRSWTGHVAYTDGRTSSGSSSSEPGPPGHSLSTGTTASIQVGVRAGYRLLLYGLAGVGLQAGPFLKVASDDCSTALSAGVDVVLSLEAPDIDEDLVAEATLASGELPLTSSGYHCYWTGTVEKHVHGTRAGGESWDQRSTLTLRNPGNTGNGSRADHWDREQTVDWTLDWTYTADGGTCPSTVVRTRASGSRPASDRPAYVSYDYWSHHDPDSYGIGLGGWGGFTETVTYSDDCKTVKSLVRDATFGADSFTVPAGAPGASTLSGSLDRTQENGPTTTYTWSLTRHVAS